MRSLAALGKKADPGVVVSSVSEEDSQRGEGGEGIEENDAGRGARGASSGGER